jgi:hypothetical protein
MAEESPQLDEDDEDDFLPFPNSELDVVTDKVILRFVPKDEPKSALLHDLENVFTEAAALGRNVPPPEEHTLVPEHEGISLRQILDQRKEEIREKSVAAESRAAELKKRIEESGPDANAVEVAAARERIIQAILELRQRGIVVMARAE